MNLRLNGWHSVLVNHILDNRSRFSRIVLVRYYRFSVMFLLVNFQNMIQFIPE